MNLIEVRFRLREWGMWRVRSTDAGQGHPSQSTIVTALQGSRSTAPFYPKDNKRAEEIDTLVNHLVVISPLLGVVIKCEYSESGCQQDKIKRLAMKTSDYRNFLNSAIYWIDCALRFDVASTLKKLAKDLAYT